MERCFLCHKKMDKKTGLCTNPKCVRSQPLPGKKDNEEVKENVILLWIQCACLPKICMLKSEPTM